MGYEKIEGDIRVNENSMSRDERVKLLMMQTLGKPLVHGKGKRKRKKK